MFENLKRNEPIVFLNLIFSEPPCDKDKDKNKDKETTTQAQSTTSTTSATTSKPPPSDGICRQEGFIGDDKDCHKFYRCVDNGKGGLTRYEFTCGEGTAWSQELETCDYEANVNCSSSPSSSSNSTTTQAPPCNTTESTTTSTTTTPKPTTTTESTTRKDK